MYREFHKPGWLTPFCGVFAQIRRLRKSPRHSLVILRFSAHLPQHNIRVHYKHINIPSTQQHQHI